MSECCFRMQSLHPCSGPWLPLSNEGGTDPQPCPEGPCAGTGKTQSKSRLDSAIWWAQAAEMVHYSWIFLAKWKRISGNWWYPLLRLRRRKKFIFRWLCHNLQNLMKWLGHPFPQRISLLQLKPEHRGCQCFGDRALSCCWAPLGSVTKPGLWGRLMTGEPWPSALVCCCQGQPWSSTGPVWGHLPQVPPPGNSGGLISSFWFTAAPGSSAAKAEQDWRFPTQHHGQVGLDITDPGGDARDTLSGRPELNISQNLGNSEKNCPNTFQGCYSWLLGLVRSKHWISREYSETLEPIPPLFKCFFHKGSLQSRARMTKRRGDSFLF